MISYFHLPLMIFGVFFLLLPMWRFWACIDRMGFMREVGQRAPMLLSCDFVAAIFAFMPILLAAADWLESPISSIAATFLSVVCLVASVSILNKSGERITPHWAGARESALRTVAALRILDAAELAHALKYLQEREEQSKKRHIVSDQMQEIQK